MALLPRSYTGTGRGLLGDLIAPPDDTFGPYEPEQPRPWIRPGSFLDALLQRPTTPGLFGETPTAPGESVRPGSFVDRLLSGPPADPYAPLADAFGGNASVYSRPQSAPASPGLPSSLVFGAPDPMTQTSIAQTQLPPKAQPTAAPFPPAAAPAMPTASPQAMPGFGDRLGAGFEGFFGAGSPMGAIGGLIGGLATGMKPGQREQLAYANSVRQALIAQGTDPAQATALATAAMYNPKLVENHFKPPSNIEEAIARGVGGGKSPDTMFDALRKYEATKAQGTKQGQVVGERQATAELDLPSAVAQANEAIRLANVLKTHKGRNNPFFWHSKSSAYVPDSAMPGNTDAYDANSILNQLKGGAFLEAFKVLKGGGQITEVEGKKATEAITRMSRAQSRAEFDRALDDYIGIIKLGVDRANQQAGRPAPNEFRGNAAQPGVYDWSPSTGFKRR